MSFRPTPSTPPRLRSINGHSNPCVQQTPRPDDWIQPSDRWPQEFRNHAQNLADMKFVHSNSIESLVKNKEKEDQLLRNNYKFMVHAQTMVSAASQSRSGRCWLFAGLNMLRREMIHHYKLKPNFELSESYLFFYHLYTQFGNLLNLFRTQTLDPHTRADLIRELIQDGGNFVDFRNLITRYGIIPKDHYSETYHSSSPGVMRWVLNNMLRKAILEVEDPNSNLRENKQWFRQKMYDCWRLLGVCLGLPPPAHKKFLFRWREYSPAQPIGKESKSKSFTPIELYHSLASAPASVGQAVGRRTLQMSDMVTLIHDPRNPAGWCTCQFESSKRPESRRWMYNVGANGMELMKQCVLNSIQNNISVWFACEITENVSVKLGGMATGLFDYETVLHTDIKMNKIQRMVLGRNCPNHAMCLNGADIDDQGNITKFRVENSWSTYGRHKGYLNMSSDWFEEYVFEVVIDREAIPNHSIRNPPQDMHGVHVYEYWDLFG